MTSITRHLVVAALVGSFVVVWRAHTDQDVVAAQARNKIMMTRLYTGPDGLTHAQDVEMKLSGGNNATEMMKATGVQFSTRPPSPASDWHPGPRRQFIITLSGHAELEVANGQKVDIGPGHIELIEDTTGKGHITHVLGPDNRVQITIPLEDQTVSTAAR
jgi:quercetin dioxygenase-like cupin family protein